MKKKYYLHRTKPTKKANHNIKNDATNSKSKWERKEIPPHTLVVGIMNTLLAREYDNWGTLKTEKIWKNKCFTWTWW